MKPLVDTRDAGVTPAMIDRLVDGELDEADRAALLRALDREPDGWKRCATAFLEAQAWRAAVVAAADGAGASAPGRPVAPAGGSTPRRQVLALAAAIAVAFCVGFVSRGPGSAESRHDDGGRSVAQRTPGDGDAAIVAQGRPDDEGSRAASPVPDDLRLRMERQGYRVEGDRTMLPVALEDGRKVAVPVDKVSLRYVGQRIH